MTHEFPEDRNTPNPLESKESLSYAGGRRGIAARGALPALAAAMILAALLPGPAARAGAARQGWPVLAQATTPNPDPNRSQSDEGDDEEEDQNTVPIPPNLLQPDTTGVFAPDSTEDVPLAPSDTTGAGAPALRDSSGILIPANPAEPETLRYNPPADVDAGKPPAPNLVPVPPKKRGGVFGLTPAILLLSLAVAHFFVVKAVK